MFIDLSYFCCLQIFRSNIQSFLNKCLQFILREATTDTGKHNNIVRKSKFSAKEKNVILHIFNTIRNWFLSAINKSWQPALKRSNTFYLFSWKPQEIQQAKYHLIE